MGLATLAFMRVGVVHANDAADGYESSPIQDPDQVLAFWTLERMHEAEHNIAFPGFPVEGPLLPDLSDEYGYIPSAPPSADNENNYLDNVITRVTGMLFYVQPGSDKAVHCTASIITSESKSVILTARHCVSDRSMWSQNLLFVPAYNGTKLPEHRAPLGLWPVKQAFIPSATSDGVEDDIAVLRLYDAIDENGEQLHVQDISDGSLTPRINEREPFPLVIIHGYPGYALGDELSYLGKQYWCISRVDPLPDNDPADAMYAPNCSAISGNSGGPLTPLANTNVALEVVGVVHDAQTHARLLPTTFPPLFEAADAMDAGSASP